MDRTAPDLLREISIRLSETAQNLERIGKRAKMASDARAPRQAVDDARYVSRASMLGVALAPMGVPVPASNIAAIEERPREATSTPACVGL